MGRNRIYKRIGQPSHRITEAPMLSQALELRIFQWLRFDLDNGGTLEFRIPPRFFLKPPDRPSCLCNLLFWVKHTRYLLGLKDMSLVRWQDLKDLRTCQDLSSTHLFIPPNTAILQRKVKVMTRSHKIANTSKFSTSNLDNKCFIVNRGHHDPSGQQLAREQFTDLHAETVLKPTILRSWVAVTISCFFRWSELSNFPIYLFLLSPKLVARAANTRLGHWIHVKPKRKNAFGKNGSQFDHLHSFKQFPGTSWFVMAQKNPLRCHSEVHAPKRQVAWPTILTFGTPHVKAKIIRKNQTKKK